MPKPGLLTRFLSGDVTTEQLESTIEREDARIHAWTQVKRQPGAPDGPLKGAPYGAKDIVETRGYRTSYGSPLFAGRLSTSDAALIELLRAKGGTLMGKTQTTAFAYFDPAPTRNPRKLEHTPGGSSSGSAAAVAAGMVPFAIGTQTQGSILRPASFCGVVGFKPTFGLLPVDGIMPFAPTLDTPGFFTQTALDMRLLWTSLGFPVESDLPPVYGMIEMQVEPDMQEMFRETIQTLGHYGCIVRRVHAPESFELALEAVRLIQKYEGAKTLEKLYHEHGTGVGVKLAMLIREGLSTPEENYLAALATLERARQDMAEVFQTYPVILSPAAVGQAPFGLGSTGDPRCNAPWTGLYGPAISIPMAIGEGLLPMGLQMASAPGTDALVIAAATHAMALLSANSL